MTEQEATAFAVRLTRIWTPNSDTEGKLSWNDQGKFYQFAISIAEGVRFDFVEQMFGAKELLLLERREHVRKTGWLICAVRGGLTSLGPTSQEESAEEFAQFADEWLPFFRRNCWLSGANIEATTHEKAEWMQGFSREELEAWNLKM